MLSKKVQQCWQRILATARRSWGEIGWDLFLRILLRLRIFLDTSHVRFHRRRFWIMAKLLNRWNEKWFHYESTSMGRGWELNKRKAMMETGSCLQVGGWVGGGWGVGAFPWWSTEKYTKRNLINMIDKFVRAPASFTNMSDGRLFRMCFCRHGRAT